MRMRFEVRFVDEREGGGADKAKSGLRSHAKLRMTMQMGMIARRDFLYCS